LRVQRTGSRVSYLLSKGADVEKFEELGVKELGRDDIQQVTVRVLTGKRSFSVDARLIDLRIRSGRPESVIAVKDAELAPQSPAPPRWSLCLTTAIVGVFAGSILGAWILRRRRGQIAGKKPTSESGAPAATFSCSGCGRRLTRPLDLAGKKIKCKECGAVVAVPAK
jgi:hypothetical protein